MRSDEMLTMSCPHAHARKRRWLVALASQFRRHFVVLRRVAVVGVPALTQQRAAHRITPDAAPLRPAHCSAARVSTVATAARLGDVGIGVAGAFPGVAQLGVRLIHG